MAERGVDPRLFVSYAREDNDWTKRLDKALSQYDIAPWWDSRLRTGRRWHPQIKEALDRADIAICLLSEGFFASSFIPDEELWEIRRRCPDLATPRDAEEHADLVDRPIDVVPVLISKTEAYERFGLDALQWPHDRNRPLSALDEDSQLEVIQKLAKELWVALGRPGPDDRPSELAVDPSALQEGAPALSPSDDVVEPEGEGLPAPTTLRGRRKDLARLTQLLVQPGNGLHRSPVVMVEGVPGVGKSALVGSLVRSLEVRALFPGGIWWVTVGQRADVADAQRRLLRMMGGQDDGARDADERRGALIQGLFRKQALIVLDDVWSSDVMSAFDVLGPSARLLVTTRSAQDIAWPGIAPYRLPALDPDAARAVLADHSGEATDRLAPDANDVVELTEGVPLGLALAGAQVRFGTSWPQVVSDLAEARKVFGPSPRSGALGAVLSSIRALKGDIAAIYRSLAVFGDDVEIPVTLLGRYWASLGLVGGEADVEAAVEELEARTLVVRTGKFVRLHDDQRDVLLLLTSNLAQAHRDLLGAARELLDAPTAWWSLTESEAYLEDHLAYHLDAAGLTEELWATVADLRWLVRRLARSCKGHRHRGSTTGLRSQGCMVFPAGPGGGVEKRSGGRPVRVLAPHA